MKNGRFNWNFLIFFFNFSLNLTIKQFVNQFQVEFEFEFNSPRPAPPFICSLRKRFRIPEKIPTPKICRKPLKKLSLISQLFVNYRSLTCLVLLIWIHKCVIVIDWKGSFFGYIWSSIHGVILESVLEFLNCLK